jgi:hypothetical protein
MRPLGAGSPKVEGAQTVAASLPSERSSYRVIQTDVASRIPERRYALTSYLPDALKPELRPLGGPRSIDVQLTASGESLQLRSGDQWLDLMVVREEFRIRDGWEPAHDAPLR